MRRFIISLIFVLSMVSFAFASDSMGFKLEADKMTLNTGDEIEISYSLVIDHEIELNAIQNEIAYDKDCFEYVNGSISVNVGRGSKIEKLVGPRIYMNDMLCTYAANQIIGSFKLKAKAVKREGLIQSTATMAFDRQGNVLDVSSNSLTIIINGGGESAEPEEPDDPGSDEPDDPGSDEPDVPGSDEPDDPKDDGGSKGIGKIDEVDDEENEEFDLPAIYSVPSFSDVKKTDWFYEAMYYVVSRGLMKGISEEKFDPYSDSTRGQIVTVLWRLEGSPLTNASSKFRDVKASDYYANAVSWAAKNNIVAGYTMDDFAPNESITREQLATILFRYAKYRGMGVDSRANIDSYSDFEDVSYYAKTALSWANSVGLIRGVSEDYLDPSGSAKRCQIATILMRFIEEI